jgi:lysophospholipase L1-like esterase
MQAKRFKIVAFGDSTTAGTPGFLSPLEAPPNGAGNIESQYAYWLMKKHGDWEVLNRGINGERSDQILARFTRDVIMERPEIVVILAGVNDIYQGFSLDETRRNVRDMYSGAVREKIIPVACTVLPYNTMGKSETEKRTSLNSWIEKESNRLKIPLCDTAEAVADPRDTNRLRGSPDGLHPDVDGYRRMAEAISICIEGRLTGQ